MVTGSQITTPLPAPSLTEVTMGTLSASPSGTSILADAVLGGAAGYLVAPKGQEVLSTSVTALATSVAGVFGLVLSAGYFFWRRQS